MVFFVFLFIILRILSYTGYCLCDLWCCHSRKGEAMPDIKRAKLVTYQPEQMYGLVNDVRSYHEFVPWCSKSHVIREEEDLVEASLTFARGGVEKSFTTMNRLHPHSMIEIKLVDGPFEHLEGFWRFEPRQRGALVILDLNFAFNHRLTGLVFGPIFQQVASMLVGVFCDRADSVYGEGAA